MGANGCNSNPLFLSDCQFYGRYFQKDYRYLFEALGLILMVYNNKYIGRVDVNLLKAFIDRAYRDCAYLSFTFGGFVYYLVG